MSKKFHFDCDLDGSIIVLCALQSVLKYSLSSQESVIKPFQRWIKNYWEDLDENTRFIIVRDIFDYLKSNSNQKESFNGLQSSSDKFYKLLLLWKKFVVERYLDLNSKEKIYIDMYFHKDEWYNKNFTLDIFKK